MGEAWSCCSYSSNERKSSHLSAVISAFFSGALETWKHFITEFTPGGIIDRETDCEKELAWVSATNDANESILGALRQFMQYHPNASLALFNVQMKYQQKGTQEWEDCSVSRIFQLLQQSLGL